MAEAGIDYYSHADEPVPHARQGHTQPIGYRSAPSFDTSLVPNALNELAAVGMKAAALDRRQAAATGKALRARARGATAITRLSTQLTDFGPEFNEAFGSVPGEHDYASTPEEFLKQAREAADDALAGVPEEAPRQASRAYLDGIIEAKAREIKQRALEAELGATRDALDAAHELNLQAAAGAGSKPERAGAIMRQLQDLDDATAAGWIAPHEAAAREAKFRGALDQADVQALIAADPATALKALQDPDAFTALEPGQREQLTRDAETVLRANNAAALGAVKNEADRRLSEGALDRDWLEANRAGLSDYQYRRFERALDTQPPAESDPAALWSLLVATNQNPAATVDSAPEAYAAGGIAQADLQAQLKTAAALREALPQKPWLTRARRDVIDAVKPSPLQDTEAARDQLGAVAAFDQWLAANPQASPLDARKAGLAIAAEHLTFAWNQERARLPLPRFAGAPRTAFALPDLTNVANRLRADYLALKISNEEFVREVMLIRRWHDHLMRQPAGVK